MSAAELIDQSVTYTLPFYKDVCVKDATPDRLISLAELAAMAAAPTLGPKLKAAAVTPYSATGKGKEHALQSLYYLIVTDHDYGNQSAADIESIYDSFGVAFLAYTTSTHQRPDKQGVIANRWKVVLPLAAPIDANQYAKIAKGLTCALGADPAQTSANQVFFAPNRIDADQPYEHLNRLNRPYLDADDRHHPLISAALQGWQEIQRNNAAKQAAATAKPRLALLTDQAGVIGLILTSYHMRELIEGAGHKRIGAAYLSPYSSSGNAGGHILQRDGKEVYYSHHGETDPLSNLNHDGHALDVADVLCHTEYRGDFSAMISAEAKKLDAEGNARRQREHMKERAALSKTADPLAESVSPAGGARLRLIDGADLAANAKAPTYLIDEVLEEDAHGIMGGLSMTYKSFMALRMAYSVCTGVEFMGRRVYRTGPVIYVCGEGAGGISRRWLATQIKLGAVPAGLFFMYGAPLSLNNLESMQLLKECIEQVRPALVIFDTFASLSGGVEENSPTEVGQCLGNVRRVCQAGGASSLIVHHFGKDATKGFRGASNFTNDVDFAYMVNRPDGDQASRKACMICHKMKDGDPFSPIHFKAKPVPLGLLDQKGQEVCSLVVEDDSAAAAGADVAEILERGVGWQKALEALRICWNEQRDRLELAGVTGKNPSVTWEDWRQASEDVGVTNPRKERDKLKTKGLIECLSGNEYRPKT